MLNLGGQKKPSEKIKYVNSVLEFRLSIKWSVANASAVAVCSEKFPSCIIYLVCTYVLWTGTCYTQANFSLGNCVDTLNNFLTFRAHNSCPR